jgi:hypothetical protein
VRSARVARASLHQRVGEGPRRAALDALAGAEERESILAAAEAKQDLDEAALFQIVLDEEPERLHQAGAGAREGEASEDVARAAHVVVGDHLELLAAAVDERPGQGAAGARTNEGDAAVVAQVGRIARLSCSRAVRSRPLASSTVS